MRELWEYGKESCSLMQLFTDSPLLCLVILVLIVQFASFFAKFIVDLIGLRNGFDSVRVAASIRWRFARENNISDFGVGLDEWECTIGFVNIYRSLSHDLKQIPVTCSWTCTHDIEVSCYILKICILMTNPTSNPWHKVWIVFSRKHPPVLLLLGTLFLTLFPLCLVLFLHRPLMIYLPLLSVVHEESQGR